MDLDEWTEPNKRRGYIGLQDDGSDCWYRNIKLRPLEEEPQRKR